VNLEVLLKKLDVEATIDCFHILALNTSCLNCTGLVGLVLYQLPPYIAAAPVTTV